MRELEDRLMECFRAVFPRLSNAEIERADMKSVAEWDSVTTITLVTLLEESFGIEIGLQDIGNLTSFAGLRDFLAADSVDSICG